MPYEVVIGLETHVQLKTKTKLFCACRNVFGEEPNRYVCPVCLGLPGSLPVLNQEAVHLAVRAALSLNCTVHVTSLFDRKNYFYPDLPKNYQITQYHTPIAEHGFMNISGEGFSPKRIRLLRLHIEEDAGKLIHPEVGKGGESESQEVEQSRSLAVEESRSQLSTVGRQPSGNRERAVGPSGSRAVQELGSRGVDPSAAGGRPSTVDRPGMMAERGGKERAEYSLVDLNRAGVPLVEIVTEPDLSSPEEAHAYLSELKRLLKAMDVSDCDMEKGFLRCDANVSLRPRGATELGTKVELKNINSFRFVQKALHYEIQRQGQVLQKGERVVSETRLYDSVAHRTYSMRSKEEVQDYRYFLEPDLPPLVLDAAWLEGVRTSLPERPAERRQRFIADYGLSEYEADLLTEARELGDYFERVVGKDRGLARAAASWILTEVLNLVKETSWEHVMSPSQAEDLAGLLKAVERQDVTLAVAKHVFREAVAKRRSPLDLLREQNLSQISDPASLNVLLDEIVTVPENEKAVADYRSGKEVALKALIGKVMQKTKGRANPQLVHTLLVKKLAERS